MEYYPKFKVPDKKTRINAIGPISNLPENTLKKNPIISRQLPQSSINSL
jgi:hypothetical protein